jgi:hypothetical protein
VAMAMHAERVVSRNASCPCGSHRRYRDCCGSISCVAPRSTALADTLADESLRLHQQGALDAARHGYERVLSLAPDHFNAMHMLGVVALQQKRPLDAVRLLLAAGRAVGWRDPGVCHDCRLALRAAVREHDASGNLAERRAKLAATRAERLAAGSGRFAANEPLVSVLLPSYRHARFIETALRSVYAQSWKHLELIVIDDGSPDDSPLRIARLLRECPFPHRFIARENRGAHATINEALAMANGHYVNVLNSDDAFAPDRIALCVELVHRAGARWGFGLCTIIDERGEPIPVGAPIAASLHALIAGASTSAPASDCFLEGNPAISSGNLFVETSLARQIGGFSALRYNHDWNFCLGALLRDEPVLIEEPLYRYRLHGRNTIGEDKADARKEADQIIGAYLRQTARPFRPANPLALCEVDDPLPWSNAWLLPASSDGAFGQRAELLGAWADGIRNSMPR